ncbi:Lrp/AsnC family transcriptional regulator [Sphingobium sp.]|uniref:Lrp/AsnC family transcriptional regulator n=1 Tax=Sphingobium sp. TaxID=1912891 RepID=UPI0025DB1B93|nr:Lrp/AsnC family transcriptional regulator [Sphingobium sp.]
MWASSSFLRHYDEAQILLKSQPQICAIGADGGQRLEKDGIIERRVAILNRDRLGLGVTVIVAIRTAKHSDEWLQIFADGVAKIPEVVEFYRMSGEIDYLLKVVARDIADYDRIYRKLTKVAELHDVSSSFAMQEIKSTTALPLFG